MTELWPVLAGLGAAGILVYVIRYYDADYETPDDDEFP